MCEARSFFYHWYMICPYCKEKVQSAALKCKHCGTDLTTDEAKEKIAAVQKQGVKMLLVLVAVIVLGAVVSSSIWNSGYTGTSVPSTAIPSPPPQRICFSAWDWAQINIKRVLQDRLKDPSSYEHIETRYETATWWFHVITKYSAKNSFWAKNVAYADYMSDSDCNITKLKME